MAKTIEPTVTPEEHDEEILGEELGLTNDEIERLASSEVIGTVPKGIESIQWAGTSGNKQEDDN